MSLARKSLARKIEVGANAATIVVAALLVAVLAKTYLLPQSAPSAPKPAPEITKGSKLDGRLLGIDWTRSHRTVVLAISTTCHFCIESAPFYHRLGAETDARIVAVAPQTISEAKEYLNGEGVRADEVRQVTLNTFGVRATPTLLLVDEAGMVTNIWVGKLQPDQEVQVLTALGKKIAGLAPSEANPIRCAFEGRPL